MPIILKNFVNEAQSGAQLFRGECALAIRRNAAGKDFIKYIDDAYGMYDSKE